MISISYFPNSGESITNHVINILYRFIYFLLAGFFSANTKINPQIALKKFEMSFSYTVKSTPILIWNNRKFIDGIVLSFATFNRLLKLVFENIQWYLNVKAWFFLCAEIPVVICLHVRKENYCNRRFVVEVYTRDQFGSVPKAIIAFIVAVTSFGSAHGKVTQLSETYCHLNIPYIPVISKL